MSQPRPLRVVIVANDGSAAPGGLSSVVRHLRSHMSEAVDLTELARSPDGATRLPRGIISRPMMSVPGPAGAISVLPCSRPGAISIWLASRLRHHRGAGWTFPLLITIAEGRSLRREIGPDTDIVHVIGNGFEGLGLAAARVARRVGARVTVWPAIHPGNWGDSFLDAKFYRMVDTVFCQSEYEREVITGFGVSRARTIVSPVGPFDGPRGDGGSFRIRLGLAGRPVVLFLARRDVYKGLRVLVDAFEAIRASVPNAALVIAGPPGDGEPVTFDPAWGVDLGNASASMAADALASANIVCVPSSAESLGIVVLDAWSRGVPVIVGPSPASRELVSCGGGVAVEQSAEEIAGVAVRLLLNPVEARAMGMKGQEAQRRWYTWGNAVSVHVKVWEELAR